MAWQHSVVWPERITDLNLTYLTSNMLVHGSMDATDSPLPEFIQICHHRTPTLANGLRQANLFSA
jgi:hypothetical protein